MSIAAACVGFSTFACFFPTFPTYSSCLPREILFLFPFFSAEGEEIGRVTTAE
jgi:hypothetical protein